MITVILILAVLLLLGLGFTVFVLVIGHRYVNKKPAPGAVRPSALNLLKEKYKDREFDGDFRI